MSRYVKKKQAAETSSHTEATLAGECVYVGNCWRLLHDTVYMYDVTVPENKDSLMRSLRAHAWQTVIASYYTIFYCNFFILHLIIPSKIVCSSSS